MTESNIAATNRIRTRIAERWPALFNEKNPIPLAIGINEALLEAMPDITADQLRRALAPWCKRPRYLAALIAGADRHGLEGIQGTVTEEQAASAAERFKAGQALFWEKNKAKHKAEKARKAEAKKKAENLEAQKTKQAEPPPAPSKPVPAAAPKPVAPVIMVKKHRSLTSSRLWLRDDEQ
jgi:ProP effector